MVVAETYYRTLENGGKDWFNPADVEVERDAKAKVIGARLKTDGQPVEIGGIEKMSKSKNNGVDPQAMIDAYGADTCRLFMMFASPPDMSLEWSDSGVEGASRFLRRVWRLAHAHVSAGLPGALDVAALNDEQKAVRRAIHLAIKQASTDVGQHHKFNTAIAQVMTLMNVLEKAPTAGEQDRALLQEGLETVALLLAPITPHICHTLWQQLGKPGAIIDAQWPKVDEAALVQDSLTLVVQVNGKLRGKVEACVLLLAPITPHACHALWAELGHDEPAIDAAWPQVDEDALARDSIELVVQVNGKLRAHVSVGAEATREQVQAAALAHPNVQRFVGDKEIRKVIVVPGKLVNIVAN